MKLKCDEFICFKRNFFMSYDVPETFVSFQIPSASLPSKNIKGAAYGDWSRSAASINMEPHLLSLMHSTLSGFTIFG